MKKIIFFSILLASSLSLTACIDKEDKTQQCTENTCSTDGKLIKCENGKTKQPESCPENQTCFINKCVENDTLTCTTDLCSADGKIIKCQNGKKSLPTPCPQNQTCTVDKCVDNSTLPKCETDTCTADGKIIKCQNGVQLDATTCEYGKCANNKCPDKPSTSCTEDTCTEDGKIIKCENGKTKQPESCPNNGVCKDKKCSAANNANYQSLIKECKFPEALKELDKISNKNQEQELASILLNMIFLFDDPAIQSVLTKFGYLKKDSSWIYEKNGLLFYMYDNPTSDCDDNWSKLNSSYFDFDKIDKTLTFTEIFKALNAISPKLLDLAEKIEKLAENVKAPINVKDAGCSLDKIQISKQSLHLLAAQIQIIVTFSNYLQQYNWETITLNDLENFMSSPDYMCDSEDYSYCAKGREDEIKETYNTLKKLNNILFQKSKTPPQKLDLVNLLAKASANYEKAMSETHGGNFHPSLNKIPKGVQEDIMNIAKQLHQNLSKKETINLNTWFKSFSFDLPELLNKPVFHTGQNQLFTLTNIKKIPNQKDSIFYFSFKFGDFANKLNNFSKPKLFNVKNTKKQVNDDISFNEDIYDNAKFSSTWNNEDTYPLEWILNTLSFFDTYNSICSK